MPMSIARLRAFWSYFIPNKGMWLIPLVYLQLVILAEALTSLREPRLGLIIHGFLLIALLLQGSFERNIQRRRFLLAMALTPLVRLLSLSLPLQGRPLVSWYFMVGSLLFLASFFTARVTGLTSKRIGLTMKSLPMQVVIGLGGIILGVVEYFILQPAPLTDEFSIQAIWLPAFVLLIFTGLLEEVIFRGLLQEASIGTLGRFGLTYVAIIFAVLHFGYRSIADVIFVFVVGWVFGLIVQKTGSLLGVSLAHGLTNISLYLIFPFLLANPGTQFGVPQEIISPSIEEAVTPSAPIPWLPPTPTPFLPFESPVPTGHEVEPSDGSKFPVSSRFLNREIASIVSLKKVKTREEGWNMWGCGRSSHPHIFRSSFFLSGFF